MELILHQRNAEQELHLCVRHAFFELKRHFTRDQIALVDIGTVDVAIEVAAGQRDQTDGKGGGDKKCAQGHVKNGRENASKFVN